MKGLKDIKLKIGDIVYYKDALGGNEIICYINDNDPHTNKFLGEIVKIERPIKYETIYEASKQILDQKEKEYLEAVIRPFRDDVLNIAKVANLRFSFIQILYEDFEDDYTLNLPHFQNDSMYKGMESNKEYTLDELGLFKE